MTTPAGSRSPAARQELLPAVSGDAAGRNCPGPFRRQSRDSTREVQPLPPFQGPDPSLLTCRGRSTPRLLSTPPPSSVGGVCLYQLLFAPLCLQGGWGAASPGGPSLGLRALSPAKSASRRRLCQLVLLPIAGLDSAAPPDAWVRALPACHLAECPSSGRPAGVETLGQPSTAAAPPPGAGLRWQLPSPCNSSERGGGAPGEGQSQRGNRLAGNWGIPNPREGRSEARLAPADRTWVGAQGAPPLQKGRHEKAWALLDFILSLSPAVLPSPWLPVLSQFRGKSTLHMLQGALL